jgi:glutamate/tyrosine decarboxylase-like PLP-dependent enzyme
MRKAMPEQGTPWEDLKPEMEKFQAGDVDWRHGRNGLNVFYAGEDVLQVAKQAYTMYMSENALNMFAFPSLKKMEDDVVSMGLSLFNAPDGASGNVSSGGTESILLAVKSCRDRAAANGTDVVRAEIVAPYSAHPAFDKAAHLMQLKLVRTPLDPVTRLPDMAAYREAITDRTIMLVGSAPAFSSGSFDPIGDLSAIAEETGLWLHVDACVGGYLAPFVKMNGGDVPPFGFDVPGVHSMSADLHKFAYAAKGASTVLYRHKDLHRFQKTDVDDWPSGRMVTPTLAGTRPGGAIAAAWAVMHYLGVEGYRAKAREITETRERFEAGLRDLNWGVVGQPPLGLINFTTGDVDPGQIWTLMQEKGWFPGRTKDPAGLHMMFTPAHRQSVDALLADLRTSAEEARQGAGAAAGEARYS